MDNENIARISLYRGAKACANAVHRHLMFFLTITMLAMFCLVFYFNIKGHIPSSMDVEEWRNVSRIWVRHGDQRISSNRVFIVTCLFIPQVVTGAPFLNVTKILCGFWFGWVKGLLICILQETVLGFLAAFLFLKVINAKSMASDIAPYLQNSKSLSSLFLLHMSSMPMHIKITVLFCHHITPLKFWSMSIFVSSLLSLKNAIIGNLLFHNRYVWAALSLAFFFSLLPMAIFIYLMIHNGLYGSVLDFIMNRPSASKEEEGIFSLCSDDDSQCNSPCDSNHDLENWRVDSDL